MLLYLDVNVLGAPVLFLFSFFLSFLFSRYSARSNGMKEAADQKSSVVDNRNVCVYVCAKEGREVRT